MSNVDVVCRWAEPEAFDAAKTLLVDTMLASEAYISHSEIQWGLSADGERWAPDARRDLDGYLDWVRSGGGRLAIATIHGRVVGAIIMMFEDHMPGRHATVQDMAVAPDVRAHGVGAALIAFVEAEARALGSRWLMLESGVRNTRAHAFFERQGFGTVSHTFAKALISPADDA